MRDKQCRPDQMLHSVVSDLDLHCLLRPVCPNIKGYYGNLCIPAHQYASEKGSTLGSKFIPFRLTLLLLNTSCPVLANSVDSDQLASSSGSSSSSGSALFVIKYVNFYTKIRIKLSDWLEIRSGHGILIYSA